MTAAGRRLGGGTFKEYYRGFYTAKGQGRSATVTMQPSCIVQRSPLSCLVWGLGGGSEGEVDRCFVADRDRSDRIHHHLDTSVWCGGWGLELSVCWNLVV